MQLEWLEDFIELVRTRSLLRAAETRCVTHPAFGRRIRALEGWVGAPWMERSRAAALDTAAHFLVTTGTVLVEDVAKFLSLDKNCRSASLKSPARWWRAAWISVEDFRGLEIIEKAGTVIADDCGTPITTPMTTACWCNPRCGIWALA